MCIHKTSHGWSMDASCLRKEFYFEMSPEVAVAVLASLLAQLPNMSASCPAPRTTTEEFSHNVGGIVRETEDAVGI